MRTVRLVFGIALVLAAAVAAGQAKKPGAAPLDTAGPAAPQPWTRYSGWPEGDWKAFNTLAALGSPPIGAPKEVGKIKANPKTGKQISYYENFGRPAPGESKRGQELAFDRTRGGSCVACHIMGPDTPELPGNVGPDLSTIGVGRTDEYLFNYVYDARVYNPQTVMPPWGAHGVFTAEEVRDIVAFLKTLTEPVSFDDPLQNPATRPVPKETRDNLDPFENPAIGVLEAGQELFARDGPKGKSCAACHAEPEQDFKQWAARMPYYEPRMKKVLGVEEFVTRHARATTGADYLMQSDENIALSMYLRHLANGAPIDVDVSSPGAKAAAKRGEALMNRKLGQLNFACVDCHSPAKGGLKWIRGQWLGESDEQLAHFPTWRTSRAEVWDIRKRYQWCNVAIRANELPPDAPEYGDIELFHASMNAGRKLDVPGIRH